MTDKGRLLIDGTVKSCTEVEYERHSLAPEIQLMSVTVKFSPSVCVTVVASLTGEMAAQSFATNPAVSMVCVP